MLCRVTLKSIVSFSFIKPKTTNSCHQGLDQLSSGANGNSATNSNKVSSKKAYHVSLYRNDGSLRYSGQMIGHKKDGWGTEFCTKGKAIYVGNWQKGRALTNHTKCS